VIGRVPEAGEEAWSLVQGPRQGCCVSGEPRMLAWWEGRAEE
jgi:hypothetical protein